MLRVLQGERQEGASAVEFALILPLLILLLLGIMETGWFLAQQVEVRHGAREAARLAAVSVPCDCDDIIQAACDRMDLSSGTASVTLSATGDQIGDTALITISSNYTSLSGFLPFNGSMQTDVDFRLEQPRLWDPDTGACS